MGGPSAVFAPSTGSGLRNTCTPEHEKPQGVPGNSNQENAGVERHNGQHNKIGQSNPQRVHGSLQDSRRNPAVARSDNIATRQPLHKKGQQEDNYQGENVHTKPIVAGPTVG
ncbi:hypothetical protein F511_47614 [Dorcoceras hygrometricum]|uniref:Uncharacterized protein n=1 Tax=Dorcoceras hygrometricum TaxID=472368 RepID=A0A2Z6ZRK6_9LAMI|nr:hypothetical protein F511_47614 [Dorcoceras hygrometricum]